MRAWGAKILSSATTVDEARWLEAHGVDAVIAQGVEAGGHRGMFLTDDLSTQLGTFALVPQIVRAVKVPVIAAGGIADAKGVAAAMALGAAGVQVGTAYLLCPEATTSAVHRAALKSEAARHTALTNVFTGRPARGIVNRVMRELGPISRRRAGVSAGDVGDRAAARQGRSPGQRRFLAAVGRTERQRLPGSPGRPSLRGRSPRVLQSNFVVAAADELEQAEAVAQGIGEQRDVAVGVLAGLALEGRAGGDGARPPPRRCRPPRSRGAPASSAGVVARLLRQRRDRRSRGLGQKIDRRRRADELESSRRSGARPSVPGRRNRSVSPSRGRRRRC